MRKTIVSRTCRIARACLLSLAVVIAAFPGFFPIPVKADGWWDLEAEAGRYSSAGNLAAAAPLWAKLAEHYAGEGTEGGWTNAALYAKRLGQYYESVKRYADAVSYYEAENEYWLKAGKDWGAEDWYRAQELRMTLDLYILTDDPETIRKEEAPGQGGLAKFEPESGVYLGLYSETDPGMGNNFSLSRSIYGRNHAIYLAYSPYSGDFPMRYADNAKKAGPGTALQIALEPSGGLDEVKDDAHLRTWAKAAKAAGLPIFLRFASEMNGDWVVWHGDPAKYIEKFCLVARVMKEEAPNVAMVWSPCDVPRYSMSAYYPGDDVVDWVGLNMYTMPYGDGQPSKPGFGTSPIERLEEVYRLYAGRKPIMLSETGVAHKTNRDGKSHTDWAVANLQRLYEIVPKKYPRVKAIIYYNQNMTTRDSLNDYLLRDDPVMMDAYKSMIASPYFLDKVATGAKPDTPVGYILAGRGQTVRFQKQTRIVPYIRIPGVFIGKVEYKLNGTVVKSQARAPFHFELDAGEVGEGAELEVDVYDSSGKLEEARTIRLAADISLTVNGQSVRTGPPPLLQNGSVLVPMRAALEALGAQVAWDNAAMTAAAGKDGIVVRLRIGDPRAEVNGRTVLLEAPAKRIDGSVMAPARFLGESFGSKVGWDEAKRTVTIATPAPAVSTAVKSGEPLGLYAKVVRFLKGLAAALTAFGSR